MVLLSAELKPRMFALSPAHCFLLRGQKYSNHSETSGLRYVCDHEKQVPSLRIEPDAFPSTHPLELQPRVTTRPPPLPKGNKYGCGAGPRRILYSSLGSPPGGRTGGGPDPGLPFHPWPLPHGYSTSYAASWPCLWARPGWAETCIHPYGRDSSCCLLWCRTAASAACSAAVFGSF